MGVVPVLTDMDPELRDLAEEFGDEELVDRVERLENELDEVLADLHDEMQEEDELDRLLSSEFSEETIDGMTLQAKREVAEAAGLRDDRTNERVNVAGQPDNIPDDSPDVTVNHSGSETYEKEVPVTPVAGKANRDDDPETKTVEYEETGPTVESINEYEGWLREARSETTREQEERARQRRENRLSGGIPSQEYMHSEEVDGEDSDVPVAGQVDREEDAE